MEAASCLPARTSISPRTLMPPLRVSLRLRCRISPTVKGKTLRTGLRNVLDQQWHPRPPPCWRGLL